MKSPPRLTATLAAVAVLAGILTACAPTVALEPADDATNAECADVVVHFPDAVADQPVQVTNAQGTGAWGSPSAVLLRCGVAVPDPTSTLPCVYVDGVYWLRDGTDVPVFVFTTYGRDPATEVVVDRRKVSPGPALYDLAQAVGFTTETGQCTEIEDSLGGAPTPTPTPTP